MSEQLKLPTPKLSKKQEALLSLLQTGRRLSKQELWKATGVWNVGDQIMKLRRAGFPIKMEKVHRQDGVEFGVYFIEAVKSAAA